MHYEFKIHGKKLIAPQPTILIAGFAPGNNGKMSKYGAKVWLHIGADGTLPPYGQGQLGESLTWEEIGQEAGGN